MTIRPQSGDRAHRDAAAPHEIQAVLLRPPLSIIIPTFNAEATIGDCLESLRRQVRGKAVEVLIVDSGSDNTAALVREHFPFAHVHHFPERKFCGAARNWGVSQAQGEVMAFLDADCTASPDWVEHVLKAHESPDPVIGGAVASRAPAGVVSWAAFFCEFSQWMPRRPAGVMSDVAGANMSYKRSVFERLGPFIEGTYCSDTQFHWRLAAQGCRPRFDPSIVVTHSSIAAFGPFLRHEYAHGRDFGRVRARHWRWPLWKRGLYLAGALVIPWKLLAQIAWRTLSHPAYLSVFLAALPVLLAGLYAWVLGECRGYVSEMPGEPQALES